MTAQVHEILILEGERTSMACCPSLPDNHPRIRYPDAGTYRYTLSTACWRGYVGTWAIQEGRLHLIGLQGQFELIPGQPLFADWFTGVIRIPRGELITYVHMGFGSVYEEELQIQFANGRVIRRRLLSNHDRAVDPLRLSFENLPGNENRFPGDDGDW